MLALERSRRHSARDECNPKKKRQHDRGGVGAGAQYGSRRSGLKLAVGRTGRRTTRQQDCRCLACAHALADDALAVVLDRRRLEHRSGWGRWRRRRRWRRIGLRGRWWWRRRRRRRRQRRGRRGGRGRIGIGMVVVARVAACDPPANAYVKKKPTRPRQASSASRRRRSDAHDVPTADWTRRSWLNSPPSFLPPCSKNSSTVPPNFPRIKSPFASSPLPGLEFLLPPVPDHADGNERYACCSSGGCEAVLLGAGRAKRRTARNG